jgi:hypothetical protein
MIRAVPTGPTFAHACHMLRAVIVLVALGVAVICIVIPLFRAAVEDDVH